MLTARVALEFCALCADRYTAQALNLPEATALACSAFVKSAFDLIELRTGAASMPEAGLVRNAQSYIDEKQWFRTTSSNEWHARILAAWRRLQSSGVLQRRRFLQGVSINLADQAYATATAAATHCSRAWTARLRAEQMRRARGARLALQALLRVFRRRLLLQGVTKYRTDLRTKQHAARRARQRRLPITRRAVRERRLRDGFLGAAGPRQ
jgi:hypothetical protein